MFAVKSSVPLTIHLAPDEVIFVSTFRSQLASYNGKHISENQEYS